MNHNVDIKNTSDAQLVLLSLEDNNNFTYLVDRYETKLMRYIERISSMSRQDAEDLLQNIFLKVFLNLRSYRDNLSFNAWIYRIAHNEIIDAVRKTKTQIKHGHYDHSDDLFERMAEGDDIISQLVRTEDITKLYQALGSLDVKYKEVLILYYLESYSYRDIGDMLKKPAGTVATRIARAKIKLKELYEKIQ